MEFEAILGSLFPSMLFNLFLYKRYLFIVVLSMLEMLASNFASLYNNRSNKGLKEEFFLIPYPKIKLFTIVFNPIISFPSTSNPLLNAIIPIELVVNIHSKIFL